MELVKKVEKLEHDMFDTLVNAYKAIESRDKDAITYYIASLEVMTDDYYDITETHYISEETILDLYERFWRIKNEN